MSFLTFLLWFFVGYCISALIHFLVKRVRRWRRDRKAKKHEQDMILNRSVGAREAVHAKQASIPKVEAPQVDPDDALLREIERKLRA